MENLWEIKRMLESQGDAQAKVEIQSKSEFQSLTASPSRGAGPPCLQIDAHDILRPPIWTFFICMER
jgi:hypothetical protein